MSNIKELKEQANAGDVEAQIELGHIYMDGIGIRKNMKKSALYFEMAAANDSADALYYLAEIYLNQIGNGVASHPDYSKVVAYYERAVKLKHLPSISGLGHLFRLGHGVEKSYTKSLEIFKYGASLGDASCMEDIAQFYIAGWGVPQNDIAATKWLKRAADLGNGSAAMFLGSEPYCNLVSEIST